MIYLKVFWFATMIIFVFTATFSILWALSNISRPIKGMPWSYPVAILSALANGIIFMAMFMDTLFKNS
jgi:hypothetical protein